MNPREYCIWLQGYLEAAGNNLSEAQVQTIKTRLDNIFEHVAEKPQQTVESVKPKIIDILDVINRYDEIQKDLEKYNYDKKCELIKGLETINIELLNDFQHKNISKFLRTARKDDMLAYLIGLIDNPKNAFDAPNTKKFIKQFVDVLKQPVNPSQILFRC